MGASQRLRASDVAAIHRLVGECRELGADARVWQQHMLHGLSRLTGCRMGGAAETTATQEGIRTDWSTYLDVGSSAQERELAMAFLASGEFPRDEFCAGLARTFVSGRAKLLARVRQQLIDDSTWYRSPTQAAYRQLGTSDVLMALISIPGRRVAFNIGLTRPVGDRPADTIEARRLDMFCRLIRPHLGLGLALVAEPGIAELSLRRKQVLAGLLEGLSEKQIAQQLGLSTPTVHEYVMDLHRHFRVSSRGELLALFLRRQLGPAHKWIERFRMGSQ